MSTATVSQARPATQPQAPAAIPERPTQVRTRRAPVSTALGRQVLLWDDSPVIAPAPVGAADAGNITAPLAPAVPAATATTTAIQERRVEHISAVDQYGEPVGFSHRVVGKAGAKPILACGDDAAALNWTTSTTPRTTVCPRCIACAGDAADPTPPAVPETAAPLVNLQWTALPADATIERAGNSYIATLGNGQRGLVMWSSFDARQAVEHLDAAADRTARERAGLEPRAGRDLVAFESPLSSSSDRGGRFRISFGNGQVSRDFPNPSEAEVEIDLHRSYSRRIGQPAGNLTVQQLDPETGEWFARRARRDGAGNHATVGRPSASAPQPRQVLARLAPDVADVLARARMTERTLTLPEQLDPDLYRRTADAIAKAGGRWSRMQECHVFTRDPRTLFAGSASDLRVVNLQQQFQAFYTPGPVADRMCTIAALSERCAPKILEPECGDGRIVASILKHTTSAAHITAFEVDPLAAAAARALDSQRLCVLERDFLDVPPQQAFDVVLMNPPFSRGADMAHVTHALGHVRPGTGALVAITSTSWQTASNRKAQAFRDLMTYQQAEIVALPAGTFSASGTDVATLLVSIPRVRACAAG